MKPVLVLSFYVLCCISIHLQVHAWTGLEAFNPDSNQTSHCFGGSFGVGAMDKGETKRIYNQCAIAECEENRNVKYTGCAPMMAKPPCFVVEGDISKPFPDCCYEVKCVESNTLVNSNE